MRRAPEPGRPAASIAVRVAAVVLAVVSVALAAQVQVPLEPVPVTLQTAAMFLAAILLGPWLGAAAAAGYLGAAVAGLPVLSDWGSYAETGLPEARTAGYVAAFVPASILLGLFARRGLLDDFFAATFAVLGAHVVVLVVGASWLASFVGIADAWTHGVAPFFVGGVAKSAAVGGLVWLLRHGRPRAGAGR